MFEIVIEILWLTGVTVGCDNIRNPAAYGGVLNEKYK
jgi:hypothetical protein